MRERIAWSAIAFGAMIVSGSAMAMTANNKVTAIQCRVTAGSKLSADLNTAICSEVKRAVAAAIPNTPFSVEVTAMSTSRLAADMKVNGKTLPQQNFAVMDSQIDRNSIRRFAQSLGEIAKAAKR